MIIGKSSIDGVSDAYYINGKESPVLTLMKGYTYFFDCNLTGHDFYLSTDMGSLDLVQNLLMPIFLAQELQMELSLFVPNNYDINQMDSIIAHPQPHTSEIRFTSLNNYLWLIIPFPNQNTISPSRVSHDLALHGL